MDAAEYKHVVLGLLFLKYVSDKFEKRRELLEAQYSDPNSDTYLPSDEARAMMLEDRDSYTAEGVFWVPDGHRWDDLRKAAKQPDIGRIIDDAMDAIEKENEALQGILPKNYNRRELSPTVLGGLIDTFSRSDLADEERKDEDLLGRVYEYMLGRYAADEGKSGGEFYTPRSVASLPHRDDPPLPWPHLRSFQPDLDTKWRLTRVGCVSGSNEASLAQACARRVKCGHPCQLMASVNRGVRSSGEDVISTQPC